MNSIPHRKVTTVNGTTAVQITRDAPRDLIRAGVSVFNPSKTYGLLIRKVDRQASDDALPTIAAYAEASAHIPPLVTTFFAFKNGVTLFAINDSVLNDEIEGGDTASSVVVEEEI